MLVNFVRPVGEGEEMPLVSEWLKPTRVTGLESAKKPPSVSTTGQRERK